MKYFTYELIVAANDWIEQSDEDLRQAEKLYWNTIENYHSDLEALKSSISKKAWDFFRNDFARYGLHDGILLSLKVGDGLDYSPDGIKPFLLNFQRPRAQIEFLNYEQDFHYLFELRGIKSLHNDLFIDEGLFAKSIGDLFTYELTKVDEDTLQLGFLFATGATIVARFRRLIFRRKRIKRQYEIGEMYRKRK